MDVQYTFKVNDKEIPYYYFIYQHEFDRTIRIKSLRERRNYTLFDGQYLPQYLTAETAKQFDFNQDYVVFQQAMIVILHSFDDNQSKDLDNFSYKPFIDTIRKTKIIRDDSWKEVSITKLGQYAEEQRIELYVVPKQYYPEFLMYDLSFLFKKEDLILRSAKEEIEHQKIRNQRIERLF